MTLTPGQIAAIAEEMIQNYKRRQACIGPWRIKPLRWLASWSIEWKPQDLWIGAFWKRTELKPSLTGYDVWVCLVPCIPIHVWWYRRQADAALASAEEE